VFNTAVGWLSLRSNSEGQFNTATDAGALFLNTADNNTAFGAGALANNTTGGTFGQSGANELGPNTAVGAAALVANTTGSSNTAVGFGALGANQTSNFCTAVGFKALANSVVSSNEAFGDNALGNNVTGTSNVGIGTVALFLNTGGHSNVALGNAAGFNATGSNNIYIGQGMTGVPGENNACYIGSIFNQTSSGGIAVFINSDGRLGTTTSSARFKKEIKPMNKASEALFSLEPVTFHYKKEIDPVGASQFGLVAEEVEKVNPDLVVRDKEGKPYSVRYDQVNAMLLNEFLKEHRKNEEQQKQINVLTAQLNEQAAQIQKVSAQLAAASPSDGGLEASKFATGRIRSGGPAPQVVNNP
jgi:Chaperone of endosialidase